MPHNNLTHEIRRARWALWWHRNDGYVYVVLFCIFSATAGALTMALYDRAERITLMRAHADEIAHFRKTCRAVVDERDEKVRQSAQAAATATQAASTAAQAVADVIEATPAPVKKGTP